MKSTRSSIAGAEEVISSLEVDRHQVNRTWNTVVTYAIRSSPIQQFGISFGVGWFSGYLFRKVSKTAAFLVGCSFIAVQGASALGLIKINWSRLGVVMQDRLSRVQSFSGTSDSPLTTKVIKFCQQHVYITSGFATGAVVALTF